MNERFGGIKEMTVLPDLVFVIDIRREKNAVDEANKLGIPVVAVVDTNCDPWPIDYIIPANDDAIRAIELYTRFVGDAVIEARNLLVAHCLEHGEMPSNQMKDVIGATRKYVIPLLEYFDAQGLTERRESSRILKPGYEGVLAAEGEEGSEDA